MNDAPHILSADDEAIKLAASFLREGKLVAFPTETVYGLGADAYSDKAIAALYAAKGRPDFNPLIIHANSVDTLKKLVVWNEMAQALADQFWPGPLTLVLIRHKDCPVSLLASAGMETLAVRIPSHPVARKLIEETGRPLAAPSANASGKLSPTTPLHVEQSLGTKVDLILAAGKSQVGVESSVLNLTSKTPTLLRPGAITIEQLRKLLGEVLIATNENNGSPLSPGMLKSHYAPQLPLRLDAKSVEHNEAYLAFGPVLKICHHQLNLSENGDLEEAAANLFVMLHQLDQPNFSGIAVAPIPKTGLGVAINDRLKRASFR